VRSIKIDRDVWVAIPSGRGIRSGGNEVTLAEFNKNVAIPSGRGIRSGSALKPAAIGRRKSQSPLVGAFVPAFSTPTIISGRPSVAIPSGRGIRSGEAYLADPLGGEKVAIPSGRGIRSGQKRYLPGD